MSVYKKIFSLSFTYFKLKFTNSDNFKKFNVIYKQLKGSENLSRETNVNFTRKRKLNGKIVGFVLPEETYNLVEQIYKKFGGRYKEWANTLRTLIYVALKNNFDNNLNYIPCKERRSPPEMIAKKRNGKTVVENISFSPKLLKKIDTLAEKNYSNRSAVIRMLICIAIQYNYDENLNYKPAERISYAENKNQYNNNVVIFLDEI